jgi:tRNA pseudouridine55 synthase
MTYDGLLIIDKPVGMTSAEAVRVVKQQLRCKAGHLGTLDPFATGVLPLCLGEATKIAQFLNDSDKEYVGIIRLGQQTDTGDLTGAFTKAAPIPELTADTLASTAKYFYGTVMQMPPMYSAIKRHGTPLYKLARQGIVVARAPRAVEISALELSSHGDGRVAFRVVCSKGTYVRVLAEQVAAALGSLGYLETLRRSRFGHFSVAEAITLDALDPSAPQLIGVREALGDLPEICIDAAAARRARQGYEPLLESMHWPARSAAAKLVDPQGRLAAVVVTDRSGRRRFGRVFGEGAPAGL